MRFSINSLVWIYAAFVVPFICAWYRFGLIMSFLFGFSILVAHWFCKLYIKVFSAFFNKKRLQASVQLEKADVILETIPPSHYCEKTRWILDKANIPYTEEQDAGILGILFTARSVPLLRIDKWNVSIGNSAQITSFLHGISGNYSEDGEPMSWLKATKSSHQLEVKFDNFGRSVQRFGYYHLLHHKDLCLRFWGKDQPTVPAWQRALLPILFPVLKKFLQNGLGINESLYAKAKQNVIDTFEFTEAMFNEDNRKYLQNTEEPTYIDYTFASLAGILFADKVPNFGYKAIEPKSKASYSELPAGMIKELDQLIQNYPKTYTYITEMFANHRVPK